MACSNLISTSKTKAQPPAPFTIKGATHCALHLTKAQPTATVSPFILHPLALILPSTPKSTLDIEESIAAAEAALAGTNGMLELRCDNATPRQMLEALDAARLPVIVTIRPTWEGGYSQKSDKDRIHLWEAAMEAGA